MHILYVVYVVLVFHACSSIYWCYLFTYTSAFILLSVVQDIVLYINRVILIAQSIMISLVIYMFVVVWFLMTIKHYCSYLSPSAVKCLCPIYNKLPCVCGA